jgi:hypothetical protein
MLANLGQTYHHRSTRPILFARAQCTAGAPPAKGRKRAQGVRGPSRDVVGKTRGTSPPDDANLAAFKKTLTAVPYHHQVRNFQACLGRFRGQLFEGVGQVEVPVVSVVVQSVARTPQREPLFNLPSN